MRIPPRPEVGLVISYAYLWAKEFRAGRREGIKDRPAAIVLARADLGPSEVAYVVPITHSPPGRDDDPGGRLLIPRNIKTRLGLDDQDSWVVLTELNVFVWPGPDLRPTLGGDASEKSCTYGFLPVSFFDRVKLGLLQNWRKHEVEVVKRGE